MSFMSQAAHSTIVTMEYVSTAPACCENTLAGQTQLAIIGDITVCAVCMGYHQLGPTMVGEP